MELWLRARPMHQSLLRLSFPSSCTAAMLRGSLSLPKICCFSNYYRDVIVVEYYRLEAEEKCWKLVLRILSGQTFLTFFRTLALNQNKGPDIRYKSGIRINIYNQTRVRLNKMYLQKVWNALKWPIWYKHNQVNEILLVKWLIY